MKMVAARSRLSWYWLLPAAFVVHDSEELFTLPSWIATHHTRLAAVLRHVSMGEVVLGRLPTTFAQTASAIAVLLTIFGLVTWCAQRAEGRGVWQLAFMVLLGGFFLHGFIHLAQAIYFGEYTPGVITAGLVVVPVSLYLYLRLDRARLLRPATAVAGAIVGLVLLVPAVLMALAAGAVLISHW